MAVLKGTLRQGGHDTPATLENITAALAGNDFFWLDLDDTAAHDQHGGIGRPPPEDDDVSRLLVQQFNFHRLAVQSAERFGQRPRIDPYDDFVYLVGRGADPDHTGQAEVHCFWTDRYVVTVHRGDCPTTEHVRQYLERHPASKVASPQVVIVYLVVGGLVDSFFPVLSKFDDRIDTLEDDILKAPTDAQLGELFQMKRSLMEMRKIVAPERDMIGSLNTGVTDIPGLTDEASRYFRDLYDHLIRVADMIDNYRDLLSSVMDTHLSTVSNRLNGVMKQLTIIATIFLPLSFLTGFFGQNFGYLVRVWLAPTWTFYVIGIGLEVATVVFLVAYFRRKGWLGGPTV